MSVTHTIEERRSGFSVYPVETRQVQVETYRNGERTVEVVPATTLFKGYRPSTFDASYDGDGWWTVDVDCGFQRWYGHQNTRAVCKALCRCGFEDAEVRRLMRKYRRES